MRKGSITCRLNILLAEKRMTVAELHKITGVSRTLLYLMYRDELQRIDIGSLAELCHFFDCKVEDIFIYKK